MESIEKNAQNRIRYDVKPDVTIWLRENEYEFLEFLKKAENGILWHQDDLYSFFRTIIEQNSFIKRMIKYGAIETAGNFPDGNYPSTLIIFSNKIDRARELYIQNAHNLEQWIRDNWEHYSTEKMEVVKSLGTFDVPDHYRMFIANGGVLHSFKINADTDKTVFSDLEKIELELEL